MMLGRFLARSLGGKQDIAEARIWLERARTAGVAEADYDLDRLPEDETSPVAVQ